MEVEPSEGAFFELWTSLPLTAVAADVPANYHHEAYFLEEHARVSWKGSLHQMLPTLLSWRRGCEIRLPQNWIQAFWLDSEAVHEQCRRD